METEFTLVIPTHGRTDLFLETLQSVEAQTLDNFHLIVTDDSPSLPDRKTIEALTHAYTNKTGRSAEYLFTKPKLGQAQNTNQGLFAVKTKYTRILHSDDLLAPATLETELKLFKNSDFSTSLIFHQAFAFQSQPNFDKHPTLQLLSPSNYALQFLHSSTPVPSAFAFTTEALKKIGGLRTDYKFLCDWEFFLRLLQHSHEQHLPAAYLSSGFVAWRTHADSTSGVHWDKHFIEHADLCKNIHQFPLLQGHPLKPFLKSAYHYRYSRLNRDLLQSLPHHPFSAIAKYLKCLVSTQSLKDTAYYLKKLVRTKHAYKEKNHGSYYKFREALSLFAYKRARSYFNKVNYDPSNCAQASQPGRTLGLSIPSNITLQPLTNPITPSTTELILSPSYNNHMSLHPLRKLIEKTPHLTIKGINLNRHYEKSLHEALKYTQPDTTVEIHLRDNHHLAFFGLKALVNRLFPQQFSWISQNTQNKAHQTLTLKRTTSSPNYYIEGHTGWTFGMLTLGSRNDSVHAFIDSIEKHCPTNYEILLIAPNNLPEFASRKNVRILEFSENDDLGWITKKKNLLCQEAQFSDILICHDRFHLQDDFFEKFNAWGHSYGIAAPKIYTKDNIRALDWAVVSSQNNTWSHGGKLHYHDTSPYAYIPGGATIIRKSFWKEFPWDESLFWNEHEDVELSRRIQRAGHPLSLTPATLIADQDRWIHQNPLLPYHPHTQHLKGHPVGEQKIIFIR